MADTIGTMTKQELLELIIEGVQTATDPRFEAIEADIAVLKSDVAELKSDVAELKQDMRSVKAQLSDLSQRIGELERWHHKADDRLETIENDIQALYELIDTKPVSAFANNKKYLSLPFNKKIIELDKEVHHLAATQGVQLSASAEV